MVYTIFLSVRGDYNFYIIINKCAVSFVLWEQQQGGNFMSKTKTSKKVRTLTYMAVLTAIMILFSFTPIGYLKLGLIEISFMTIPVIVGAIVLGPLCGAILGGIFGISSFLTCFGIGVPSAFGATLLAINPFYTFIVCFVSRVLMGLLTGFIFKWLRKIDKTKIISFGITGLCGSVLNTILFMSSLLLLFWNTSYIQELAAGMNVFAFVVAFVGIQGLVEALVCFVVATAVSKILVHFLPVDDAIKV